jgi:hypothetical protein
MKRILAKTASSELPVDPSRRDGQIIVHYGKFNGRAGASWIIPGLRRRIVVSAQRGNSKSGVADAGFQVHMPKKKALP